MMQCWIVWPQMGLMYRVIRKYRDEMNICTFEPRKPFINHENFLNVYFDRRHKDLKLLLNLLAETSGLPESFRILTLFDKKFQTLWKPQNLRFEEYETVIPNNKIKSHSIIVRWNDAPIGHFLANYDSSLSFEYTIDINPGPSTELGLKSVLFKNDLDDICNGNTIRVTAKESDAESFSLLEKGTPNIARRSSLEKKQKYEVSFENITQQEDEYTVTISTELNGRTVTQTVERFPMGQTLPNST